MASSGIYWECLGEFVLFLVGGLWGDGRFVSRVCSGEVCGGGEFFGKQNLCGWGWRWEFIGRRNIYTKNK